MPDAPPRKPPLLVFSDDWGRHPSSCQHLIRELLPTRQVTWVNTIGTRPPRMDWQTVRRVGEKLLQWTNLSGGCKPPVGGTCTRETDGSRGDQVAHGGLTPPAQFKVLSPKMWPSFKSKFARGLNKKLLLRTLTPAVAAMPEPPVVITTLPLIADLHGLLPAKRWVYYCVDDFGEWPGYDGPTMRQFERELVPRVDEIVAVSDTLVSHIKDLGRDAHLLSHGVDLDFWQRPEPGIADEFHGLVGPYVVFWGVIDRRMDVDFVKHLSERMTEGTIVLFGPQDDPDPLLARLPRVELRPPVPFRRLPTVAASSSVLVMPYADLPVTRAIQPLKLKEYLATGKPTVVRGLPSTYPWAAACDVCDTAERFTQAVLDRLRDGILPSQPFARQSLDEESWAGKARRIEAWIDG